MKSEESNCFGGAIGSSVPFILQPSSITKQVRMLCQYIDGTWQTSCTSLKIPNPYSCRSYETSQSLSHSVEFLAQVVSYHIGKVIRPNFYVYRDSYPMLDIGVGPMVSELDPCCCLKRGCWRERDLRGGC